MLATLNVMVGPHIYSGSDEAWLPHNREINRQITNLEWKLDIKTDHHMCSPLETQEEFQELIT